MKEHWGMAVHRTVTSAQIKHEQHDVSLHDSQRLKLEKTFAVKPETDNARTLRHGSPQNSQLCSDQVRCWI